MKSGTILRTTAALAALDFTLAVRTAIEGRAGFYLLFVLFGVAAYHLGYMQAEQARLRELVEERQRRAFRSP